MSPLPHNVAEPCEPYETHQPHAPSVGNIARPNLAEIAAELTLLDETILQRLG